MNPLLRRALPLAAAILLSSAAAAADVKPAATPGYRVVNLMPAYWDFYAKTRHLSPEAQAEQFKLLMAKRYPDAYSANVLSIPEGKQLDAEVVRRYALVQGMIGTKMDVMRSVSDRIGKDLQKYETAFRKTFPDLAYDGEIYFMHSIGGFDGGLRDVKGKRALLFGLDMITYVYGTDADPQPFFHHELFHLYHHQFDTKDQPAGLLPALWAEGLATYVAQALNPGSGGVAIFGLPRSTPKRVVADVPAFIKGFRAVMDSTSSEDYRRYFMGKDEDAAVPARSGYVLGYLVAKKLAKRHTLQELAHTPVRQLRPEIEQALAELEAGEAVSLD
ncbi:MAG TPA: DUF2268 domain-containing putative Zn-dependent protease [Telluria sp.]|nr:DUF2268 domain-containing putative Zn-dependent protease [Telluria sp.]